MPVYELFSERLRRSAPDYVEDPYVYDEIPNRLREQVRQILEDAFGEAYKFSNGELLNNIFWHDIEKAYRRETGLGKLASGDVSGNRVSNFMADCYTLNWIDILELACNEVASIEKHPDAAWVTEWEADASDVLDEINLRLRRAGVGYQYEGGQIVRVDSQVVHQEIVKPAIGLLSAPGFEGANQEFMDAHAKYREGDHRGAVSQAANALESTFKAIFDKKGWAYNKGNRISDLVKVARSNKLWPDYLDGSFDQLISTLQSGLPKIRDNDASHGQGSEVKVVPHYVAALALHLAASKIVFLVEAANS